MKRQRPRASDIFGEPEPSEPFLVELAREYYTRTATYDTSVCTARSASGEAIPANMAELARVNQHALDVRQDCERQALAAGFTTEQWFAARRLYVDKHG
ncbi:hypothetical protein PQ43W_51 [Ralstonia phage PQ43W]